MGKVHLIFVPYDSGRANARMGNGPHRLQQEGLPERLRKQKHLVHTTTLQLPQGKFQTEVGAAFELMTMAKQVAFEAHEQDVFPIAVSGNCNISIGMLSALQSRGEGPVSLVWFDAHGDFNTPETSQSGFFDGMALSVLTGRSWRKMTVNRFPDFQYARDELIIHACGRDYDAEEGELLKGSGIHRVESASIMNSPAEAFGPSIQVLRERSARTHLHVDFDALDPLEAPANEYAAPHGISVAKMKESIECLCATLSIQSASFSAYDPSCDPQNKTAAAAIDLISVLCRCVSLFRK